MMRAAGGAPGTQFLVATVPPGRPPLEFKRHGLRNLPAVISGGEGLDTVEEIIDFIAVKPDTATHANNVTDTVATDFFSKFCFFIKVTTGCLNIFVSTKNISVDVPRQPRAGGPPGGRAVAPGPAPGLAPLHQPLPGGARPRPARLRAAAQGKNIFFV